MKKFNITAQKIFSFFFLFIFYTLIFVSSAHAQTVGANDTSGSIPVLDNLILKGTTTLQHYLVIFFGLSIVGSAIGIGFSRDNSERIKFLVGTIVGCIAAIFLTLEGPALATLFQSWVTGS